MTTSCDGFKADGHRGQQTLDHFDAERQPQVSSSSQTSKNVSFQKYCSDGLQRLLKPREWMHYQQNGEKKGIDGHMSAPFSIGLERPSAMDAPIFERVGQCCFLCLGKRRNQIAIAVPCFRPTKERKRRYTTQRRGSPTRRKIYREIGPKERVRESDAAIFERLVSACYEYHSTWRKWLPFYGITKVEEVTVSHL